MKKHIYTLLIVFLPLLAVAKTYKLEGTVGGKYPIVIELEQHEDGLFSGRYAYKATLQKKGKGACSWFDINPSYEKPATQWTVRDCTPDVVETWYMVNFNDRKHLTATIKNSRGQTFVVSANVIDK